MRARIRRAGATGGVLAACMGMMIAFAVPAQAAQAGVFDGQFAAHNRLLQQLEAQTLTTSNITAPLTVVRDGVKATTESELEAAAEAKRLEEERAAEAVRQAELEAELANSASVASAESTSDESTSDESTSGESESGAAASYAGAQSYSGGGVIGYASQFVGVVPYGMGNHPSDSFSCDGFTQYVFAGAGIYLPRGADAQGSMGTQISQSEAVAGDLVWWPGQHIGIYDGAGGMYDSPDWGRTVQHRQGSLWGSPVFVRI